MLRCRVPLVITERPGFYRSLDSVDIHRRRPFIGADENKTEDKGVHRVVAG